MPHPSPLRRLTPLRPLVSLAVLATVAPLPTLGPTPLTAQDGGSRPRAGCLRGAPADVCSSFWITEMQAVLPIAQTTRAASFDPPLREVDLLGRSLEWNVGHMWNTRGGGWAFGATLTAATHAKGLFSGARLRGRRWLNPALSLESSVGYTRTEANPARMENDHGVSWDLRLNSRDLIGVFLRWDRYWVEESAGEIFDAGGEQDALVAGASVGSIPGLVGSGIFAVGFGVAVLAFAFLVTT